MTSYTPGPWAVFEKPYRDAFDGMVLLRTVIADNGRDADVVAYLDDAYPASVEANARLIAAAPSLLEAAKQLIDAIEKQLAMTGKGITPSPRVAAALAETRAAIAAAEGVQP